MQNCFRGTEIDIHKTEFTKIAKDKHFRKEIEETLKYRTELKAHLIKIVKKHSSEMNSVVKQIMDLKESPVRMSRIIIRNKK